MCVCVSQRQGKASTGSMKGSRGGGRARLATLPCGSHLGGEGHARHVSDHARQAQQLHGARLVAACEDGVRVGLPPSGTASLVVAGCWRAAAAPALQQHRAAAMLGASRLMSKASGRWEAAWHQMWLPPHPAALTAAGGT